MVTLNKNLTDYISEAVSACSKAGTLKEFRRFYGYYEAINTFKLGKTTPEAHKAVIEEAFGNKITCNNCPSVFRKACEDMENFVFATLQKNFAWCLPKLDQALFANTTLATQLPALEGAGYAQYQVRVARWADSVKRLADKGNANEVLTALQDFNILRLRHFEDSVPLHTAIVTELALMDKKKVLPLPDLKPSTSRRSASTKPKE